MNVTLFACLALFLAGVTVVGRADALDDFNDPSRDVALWGTDDTQLGAGRFTETGGVLAYSTVGAASPEEDAAIRFWRGDGGLYTDDWSVRLDVRLPAVALGTEQELEIGLITANAADPKDSASLMLNIRQSGPLSRLLYADLMANGVSTSTSNAHDFQISTTATNAAIRIRWEASARRLHFEYDADGPEGGYVWSVLGAREIGVGGTDWGMSATSRFQFGILGRSFSGLAVAAGSGASADNFFVQTEGEASPREEWEFAGPQPLSVFTTSGAAYGAGRWAATSWGWVTTSEDGARWKYPKSPRSFDDSWSRMAHLGGKFIWWGVGREFGPVSGTFSHTRVPRLLISEEGLTWQDAVGQPGAPEQNPFRRSGEVASVAFGNGIFVAVGSQWLDGTAELPQGAIWHSADALHWTRVYRLKASGWRELQAVSFGDGKFIGVGANGTVVVSTNGIDWNETQDPLGLGVANPLLNTVLGTVVHGPQGWFIGTGMFQAPLHSVDGTTWSRRTVTGFPADPNYHSYYQDGRYWLTGVSGSWTSVDGSVWTRVLGPQGESMTSVRQAPAGVSPRFLAGSNLGRIFTSEDGATWRRSGGPAAVPGEGRWPHHQTVVPTASGWLVSGSECHPASGQWNQPNDGAFGTHYVWWPRFRVPASWSADAGGLLEWGLVDTPVLGDYVETPDGLVVVGMVPDNSNSSQRLPGTLRAGRISAPQYSLTTATLASLSRTTGTLLYNGLSPLIVGEWGRHRAAMTKIPGGFDFYSESVRGVGQSEGGSTIHWGHYTSPNGTDWTRRANGLNDIKKFPGIRGLAHGAGRYVAVGLGSSPGLPSSDDRIYTSVDGENYSAVSLAGITPALTEGLTGLAFANGMFVATGNEGRILRSTDGLNWETVLNSGGGGWNRVRFLGAHWTLAGDAGRVAFSPDGRVWTIKRTGVVNDLNDIALRDDTYLAVGNNGMVLRSLFTPPPLPPSIDTQPATATVSARSALLLSVTATRATSYQWKFEGEKIPGATNAQYRIPAVDVTHAGRYTVVVGNTAGSVESAAATITVTRLDLYPGILVAGPVGAVYRVEWTTEATGDGGWTLLRAITLDQPSYVVIDPQPANQPRRFYRVVPGP